MVINKVITISPEELKEILRNVTGLPIADLINVVPRWVEDKRFELEITFSEYSNETPTKV